MVNVYPIRSLSVLHGSLFPAKKASPSIVFIVVILLLQRDSMNALAFEHNKSLGI